MKVLMLGVLCVFLAINASLADEEQCDYSMQKMCSMIPNASYTERGCWYYCRIKAEFEAFSGTFIDGAACHSVRGYVAGTCKHARSRMTFTTGVTSSPSRYASKIINGSNNKSASQKSKDIEMGVLNKPHNDSLKEMCVTIGDTKERPAYT